MPELPEVEVVRRGLDHGVVGRTIASVEVLHPRAVRRHAAGPADFAAQLTMCTIVGTRRRGKYLWFPLDSGDALLGHLGMSGQLVLVDPKLPPEKHLRVRFAFTDGRYQLRFIDQRTFGHLMAVRGGATLPQPIAHIAADPLEEAFDADAFRAALRRRRTGIKRALLDQSLISGIGNIYADEALWRARLHPARPTETLTARQVRRLVAAVRDVMVEAMGAGGTTFDSLYVNVNGESGYFDRELAVYGQRGLPCRRCGTPIERAAFMNRSSYTCPRCQPRPRRGRW